MLFLVLFLSINSTNVYMNGLNYREREMVTYYQTLHINFIDATHIDVSVTVL